MNSTFGTARIPQVSAGGRTRPSGGGQREGRPRHVSPPGGGALPDAQRRRERRARVPGGGRTRSGPTTPQRSRRRPLTLGRRGSCERHGPGLLPAAASPRQEGPRQEEGDAEHQAGDHGHPAARRGRHGGPPAAGQPLRTVRRPLGSAQARAARACVGREAEVRGARPRGWAARSRSSRAWRKAAGRVRATVLPTRRIAVRKGSFRLWSTSSVVIWNHPSPYTTQGGWGTVQSAFKMNSAHNDDPAKCSRYKHAYIFKRQRGIGIVSVHLFGSILKPPSSCTGNNPSKQRGKFVICARSFSPT